MFKLRSIWKAQKYGIVGAAGLALMALCAFGGWRLGQNARLDAENTHKVAISSPQRAKSADNLTVKRFQAYSPGRFYGMPEPETTRQFMHTLQQRAEEHRRAVAAELARCQTRQLVAPDRSNIDCSRMKCLALTYDDGPDRRLGNKLLDILSNREAVATFFVVGNRAVNDKSLLKRMAAEKSEAGNHSWSHANLKLLTDEQIAEQVTRTNQVIFEATGKRPHLMRPPYAKRDARVIKQINMPIALWNIDPEDWRAPNAQAIYRHVIAKARPGAVVIMHEIKDNTVKATPLIIDELQRQGYVLVTMSEMFGITDKNASQFAGKLLYHH